VRGRAATGSIRPVRRLLAAVALAALAPLSSARAGDAADDARRAKVEAGKRAVAEDAKAFRERVNAAIDKGVAWLRTQQRSNGSFPGYNDGLQSLVMLTLAKSGVKPEDKAFEKLKTYVLADYAKMKGLKAVKVYSVSVMLMAFEAAYREEAKDETDVTSDRYGTTVTRKKTPCKYPGAVATLVDELAKFLIGTQTKSGGWRYPGLFSQAPAGEAEMSNTQYALLGLNAAARCNTKVPVEVWNRALAYVLADQEKDGLDDDLWVQNDAWEPGLDDVPRWRSGGKRKARGWRYTPDGPNAVTTGSMTTAGVAALGIVKERLAEAGKLTPDVARRIDSAMLDGLVWLSQSFSVRENPTFPAGGKAWHFYYLYGLERVGSLTGVRFVGQHDWYREGADLLVGDQRKDGGWTGAKQKQATRQFDEHETDVTQTCFALLFLRRSTAPPIVPITPPALTGSGDEPPTDIRTKPGG
jgi:hypothetical protein